jgi:hypothetical protein
VLLGVGMTAALSTLGSIAKGEGRGRDKEFLQRLAIEKYDELVTTNQQPLTSSNGDFTDRNISGYTWNLDVEPSSTNNLDTVVVTVTKSGAAKSDPEGKMYGLIYLSPSTTSSTTTAP